VSAPFIGSRHAAKASLLNECTGNEHAGRRSDPAFAADAWMRATRGLHFTARLLPRGGDQTSGGHMRPGGLCAAASYVLPARDFEIFQKSCECVDQGIILGRMTAGRFCRKLTARRQQMRTSFNTSANMTRDVKSSSAISIPHRTANLSVEVF